MVTTMGTRMPYLFKEARRGLLSLAAQAAFRDCLLYPAAKRPSMANSFQVKEDADPMKRLDVLQGFLELMSIQIVIFIEVEPQNA